MKYEELSKKLYKKVMSEYNNRKKWDKRSLSTMVDEQLKDFNKDAKKLIEKQIYDNLNQDYFSKDSDVPLVANSIQLSKMLYKNAKEISPKIVKILADGNKAKKTIKDISMQIYDGYNSGVDNLGVKEKLPKYLNDSEALKNIDKLVSKNLKISYKKVLEAMEDIESDAFEKALHNAIQEKSRYYADRIARTEAHRSLMLSRAKEYFEDEEIKLVKYTMSSSHKIMDICNYYANIDVGYGAGVVPKSEMVALGLHPHCRCTYVPVYKEVKKKKISNPVNHTMNKFSLNEQQQILGSNEKLNDFKDGANIESIFNRVRPNYQLIKYKDVFK